MAATDENALICDFAEIYHIFAWRQLPARLAATLAAGLTPDSRIKLKLSGSPGPVNSMLLAMILDCCRLIFWQHSRSAFEGKKPPPSLFKQLYGKPNKEQPDKGFASGKDFSVWREKMLNGGEARA